jgi:hypothetical protein
MSEVGVKSRHWGWLRELILVVSRHLALRESKIELMLHTVGGPIPNFASEKGLRGDVTESCHGKKLDPNESRCLRR